MTSGITTLSIMDLDVVLRMNNTHLPDSYSSAECGDAECRYAECHHAECCYYDCHDAKFRGGFVEHLSPT